MKKFTLGFAALLLALILFVTRPWSDYPILGMLGTFDAETRAENFRNMDDVYPHIIVPASDAPMPFVDHPIPLNLRYRFQGQDHSVDEFLARTESTSLLVIKDGKLLHEEYLNGAGRDSRFTSWSVAKSFVSTLIGMARDEGLIKSVEDSVSTYMPELKGTAYGNARVRDVLQMSSGVDFSESYGSTGGNTALAFSSVQRMLYKGWILGMSLDEQLAGYDQIEEPGTRFYYRSSDTHLLSALLRRIYDKPFEDLLAERIWQPLGMESFASWSTAAGQPIGFCCLNATARDYAKLGQLFLSDGNWHGTQLVSRDWVREATVPSHDHVQPANVYGHRGYQYQWWVPKDYDGEFFANGIWGQVIWVSRANGVVIVRTATDPRFRENTPEMIAVMRAIAREASGAENQAAQ